MPYINSDGTVSNSPPFLVRVKRTFWSFVEFLNIFVRTLVPGINPNANTGYVSSSRSAGSGGGPRPPQRRLGGFKTLSDCAAPMPGGG